MNTETKMKLDQIYVAKRLRPGEIKTDTND